MSVITACSASGSPGVTLTALGLALAWPRDVVLADCDRTPAQTIQAGWLAGVDCTSIGLDALLSHYRSGGDVRSELVNQTVPLDPGRSGSRFLPGFGHPGAPAVFDPVWPDLAAALDDLDDSQIDAIVDAGRIGGQGLPEALVSVTEVVMVVTRTHLRALVALRLHLPLLIDQVTALAARAEIGLLLVGEGMPYTAGEISSQFGIPVWASLPFDLPAATTLGDGVGPAKRYAASGLARAQARAARALLARAAERRVIMRPELGVAT